MIVGSINLPDEGTMIADSQPWHDRNRFLETAYEEIDFHCDYTQHLVDLTDHPDFNIPAVIEMFKVWKGHKKKAIMEHRDWGFASTLTGAAAPMHRTKWVAAIDDSTESYLATSDE